MDSNLPSTTLPPKNPKRHFQITGERLLLRPYARRFVEQYHGWFVDEELLYLTGSEPLSLQEEYENQQSWLTDPLKYTFLIFAKSEGEEETLVGDINLFFSKWIEPNQAEINIMIARKDHRGKGHAREALLLVQAFARVQYGRNEIIAKIKDDNAASMRLFEKMGYQLVNHSEHFQETEYRKHLDQPIEEYQKVLTGMEEVLEVDELFGN